MELQDAISHAIAFAKTALSQDALTVEEVEYEDSPPAWRITLGFKRKLPAKPDPTFTGPTAALAEFAERHRLKIATPPEFEDVYKMILIPEDGSKPSMKIRKV